MAVFALLGLSLSGCGAKSMAPGVEPPPVAPPREAGTAAPAEEPDQPPPGVFHRVLRGQTLYTIARTYGVPLNEIAAANHLADPARIEAGALLFIPRAATQQEVAITVPALPVTPDRYFLRPVAGPVNSPYGPRRKGRMHFGLDFGAPAGTTVHAARDGVVLYAGHGYQGYGNLVILDHGDGYQSLYAHNRKLLAKQGRKVHAGEAIATVGSSGNASGPHLHFEIRRDNLPLDPEPFLQSTERASAAP